MTDRLNEELALLDRRISISMEHRLTSEKQSLGAISARLVALNPMNVLARGYAAVFDTDKNVIDSVKKVSEKQKLTLMLADGSLDVTVDAVAQKSEE